MILSKDKFDVVRRNPYSIKGKYIESIPVLIESEINSTVTFSSIKKLALEKVGTLVASNPKEYKYLIL